MKSCLELKCFETKHFVQLTLDQQQTFMTKVTSVIAALLEGMTGKLAAYMKMCALANWIMLSKNIRHAHCAVSVWLVSIMAGKVFGRL